VIVSLDGRLSALDGGVLLTGLLVHAAISLVLGRREANLQNSTPVSLPFGAKPVPLWLAGVALLMGIGLLVLGSQFLVNGAVGIASSLGVSGLVLGLTVVALGTSLPELATAIVALRRGERDMAVGNIVGSNIFNIGMVLGVPAMFFDGGSPHSCRRHRFGYAFDVGGRNCFNAHRIHRLRRGALGGNILRPPLPGLHAVRRAGGKRTRLSGRVHHRDAVVRFCLSWE